MGQYDSLRANALILSKAGLLQTANKLNRLADYLEGKRTSLKDLSVIYSDTGEDGDAMVKVLRLKPELKSVINNAMYDAAVVMKSSGSPVASNVLSDMNNISDTGVVDDSGNGSNDYTPLCITALADMEFSLTYTGEPASISDFGIEYKVNDGAWNSWVDWDGSVALSENDKLYLKGNRTITQQEESCIKFSTTNEFNISGDVMSLVSNRETPNECEFAYLLSDTSVVDAEDLVLPNMVSAGCCIGMFKGCSSLMNAPVLRAERMVDRCYAEMFMRSSISKVECHALFDSESNGIINMLDNIRSMAGPINGELLVKHSGDWIRLIPDNWTVSTID